jgi:glutaredoxin
MLHIYIKPWCPWCVVALETLDALGCDYTPHDVEREPGAAEKVRQLSNQTRVPTMQAGGHVLADFGPEEIVPFLTKHGIHPKPHTPTS